MNPHNLTLSSTRGFSTSEFEERTQKIQTQMHMCKLDAILLTEEANVRYFSGFHSQFWHSPTRPWFLIIPAQGKPIAVIPEIGVSGMQETWIDDIHSWPSPNPRDDGISLLTKIINNLPTRFGNIGAMLGNETFLRMPYNNFQQLCQNIDKQFIDASQLIHSLRQIKSSAEINKIREICYITQDSFSRVEQYAKVSMTEREICQKFSIDMLLHGADECPYVIAGSGPDGYDSIIMGPLDKTISNGDILIIDTGSVRDGYFADFDRNWAFGKPSNTVLDAYRTIYKATTKGFEMAYPGNTTTDVFHAMWQVLAESGSPDNDVGRMGHGLGMQLTETPSITANDNTVLKPRMVLTLEPSITYLHNKTMVHEENIVITDDGAEWLTKRATPELTIIE